ncbi:MAG: hypothetical protein ABIT82_04390 [Ramlibacter sp.]
MAAYDDSMRHSQEEISRAEQDYERLRNAYLKIARTDPGHEVGLAMVGADMDKAHARLQALIGLRRLPFSRATSSVVRREADRVASENT